MSKQKLNGMFNKDENHRKIWDHSYYTGKNRDAAGSICNVRHETLK